MRIKKYLPNRRSMGKRARLYQKNRKVAAANKIKSAYRSYRGRRPYLARRLISGGNYIVKKVRLNKTLTFSNLKTIGANPQDPKRFEIYFAPWANVETVAPTTNPAPAGSTFGRANLFYHQDFNDMFTGNREYNMFRLRGVYMEIRRPKVLIDYRNGGQVVQEFHDSVNHPWGTEILHTKDEIVADTTTGVLQPVINNVNWGRTIAAPSTWSEAIDDGSRFKVTHGNYQKRVWKPATPAERKWRFTNPGVELEHSTGGITLMLREGWPIPYVEGPVYQPTQIMFDIVATVYMEFKTRI